MSDELKQLYTKHSFSQCEDLMFSYRLDHSKKRVAASVKHIDSALILSFAHYCKLKEGIELIRDERSGKRHRPAYALFLHVFNREFWVDIVNLVGGDEATVILKEIK